MAGPADAPSLRAWRTVFVLMIAYLLAMIDRTIVSLMIEPLQRDLGLTDTQFGLLTGMAFALFYAIAGLPLGWLVDNVPRRTVIAGGIGLWSVMTALSGAASSFAGLFAARVGVGVGEAALNPGAYSMIADMFRGNRLGRALAVFSSGTMIGAGLAFALGGALVSWLNRVEDIYLPLIGALKSWQLIFLIAGAPGILLAIVVLRLPEPARSVVHSQDAGRDDGLVRFLRDHWGTLLLFTAGPSLLTLNFYAFMTWTPAMLIRKFALDPATVGLGMGVAAGFFGLAGLLAGGALGDRWVKRGSLDAHMHICAGAMLGALPFGCAAILSGHWLATMACFFGLFFCLAMPSPCIVATLQLMSPSRLRGRLSAIYLMICNIVGMGLGPLLVGVLNDRGGRLTGSGRLAIDQSLLIITMIFIPLTVLAFVIARKPVRALAALSFAGQKEETRQ